MKTIYIKKEPKGLTKKYQWMGYRIKLEESLNELEKKITGLEKDIEDKCDTFTLIEDVGHYKRAINQAKIFMYSRSVKDFNKRFEKILERRYKK